MIELGKNRYVVESLSELPEFPEGCTLHADAETTSFDDREAAFRHHHGHRVCGWAVRTLGGSRSFYVPIRHRAPGSHNLDPDAVSRWFENQLKKAKVWRNYNIKFDAHFAEADGITIPESLELWDTKVHVRMYDTDSFRLELKAVAEDKLGVLPETRDRVKDYLKGVKSKDYGRLPIDLAGDYACNDVEIDERLWEEYLLPNLPESIGEVWRTEQRLTPVLLDMERRGLRINRKRVLIEKRRTLLSIIQTEDDLKELTGDEFTNSNKCMTNLFLEKLGLPVVKVNKDKKTGKSTGPSFDKEALAAYASLPEVILDERKKRIVELVTTYRNEERYLGLYLDSFLDKAIETDGIWTIHSDYNQLIRTARMSCRTPNTQQFDDRAGALIIPRPGFVFVCFDASQLEFRLIAHGTKDPQAIEAYNKDPRTDYHSWVAELCGIDRKPAKTINFGVAFGEGRKKLTRQLMGNDQVIAGVLAELGEAASQSAIKNRCADRAREIYETYHDTFPRIRKTNEKGEAILRKFGYIANAYGRRRHLSVKAAYKTLNTYSQGSGGDYVKEKMVDLAPRYNERVRSLGAHQVANKHDELLWEMPKEVVTPGLLEEFKTKYSKTRVQFRVPMLWDAGTGKTWKEAKP